MHGLVEQFSLADLREDLIIQRFERLQVESKESDCICWLCAWREGVEQHRDISESDIDRHAGTSLDAREVNQSELTVRAGFGGPGSEDISCMVVFMRQVGVMKTCGESSQLRDQFATQNRVVLSCDGKGIRGVDLEDIQRDSVREFDG